MIPPDITREDILAALKEIDENGEPVYRESKVYSLIYNKRQYSPKYVLSVVIRLKTGKELSSKDFDAKSARNFFIDNIFPIVSKEELENSISILKGTSLNKDRYSEMSTIISARDEVYSKFNPAFSLNNIDNLTSEEFVRFLEFKNNKHWTGLTRRKAGYLNNISGVRKILHALLDENIQLSDKFQAIEKIAEDVQIKGIGKGILTAILHIAYPEKYGIWNGTSEGGLKKIGLWPAFRSKASEGEKYFIINEILKYLSIQVGVDLWTLDALWWKNETLNTTKIQLEPILEEHQRLDRLLIKKGQVILYGPPGTGKTYCAGKYIESKIKNLPTIPNNPQEINRNFYWFTINPDRWDPENLWKQEEVVLWYGNVKPAFAEIEESDLVFCYASGVQYHRLIGIATCIKKTYSSEGIPQVIIKGLQSISGPDWKTMKSDGILSASHPVRTGARGTLFSLSTEEGLRILSMQNLAPAELGIEEQPSIQEIRTKNVITFHPSFSYEEFIEGIMPSVGMDGTINYKVKEGIFKEVCRNAFNSLLHYLNIEKTWNAEGDIPSLTREENEQLVSRSQELPHFLMIDEINRGDISRIFGELITLLEKDKRATGQNELSVILPYSRTRFAIPPNLFIIGTMNTADKSIALVDVALRRRFGFIEMIPDREILREYLSHDSLEIQKVFTLAINLLEEINVRITKEYDRNHQLGHSYLMRLKGCSSPEEAISELWSIWYDEMIPLLQEYFYDAPNRLYSVIGDGFVEYNAHSLILLQEKDEEEFIAALQKILDTETR